MIKLYTSPTQTTITHIIENICFKYGLDISSPPIEYCTDNGVMIAWNGCLKLKANSNDIIRPINQTKTFFNELKPEAKSSLGKDISFQLKLLEIKNKR